MDSLNTSRLQATKVPTAAANKLNLQNMTQKSQQQRNAMSVKKESEASSLLTHPVQQVPVKAKKLKTTRVAAAAP